MVDRELLRRNLLLLAMPEVVTGKLSQQAELMEAQEGQIVLEPERRSDVFFPIDAVVSLLLELEDGTSIETAMVGAEGCAGLHALLGVAASPYRGIIQGAGLLARFSAPTARVEIFREPGAMDVFLRYVNAHALHSAQLAACNRLHVVTERLAHWLLLLHDRTGSAQNSLTQEFLARMLGTRRAGINAAMRDLTEAGAITHARNRVRIADRVRLEEESCSCYEESVRQYEYSLGFSPRIHARVIPQPVER